MHPTTHTSPKKLTTLGIALFTVFCAILSLFLSSPNVHASSTTALSLSPVSGSVAESTNITLTVYINPGGSSVNTVQSQLTYPSANFSFVSEAPAGSFVASSSPTVIQSSGIVDFAAAIAAGGTAVSGNSPVAVATVVLKSTTTPGTAAINLASSLCSTSNYALTCSAAYDSSTSNNDLSTVPTGSSYTVTAPVQNPTINTFTASSPVTVNTPSSFAWTTSNATSCTASGGGTGAGTWSGTEPTSSTGVSVTPTAAGTYTYTLTCSGATGTTPATQNVTVVVNPAPTAPTVTLTANPTSITSGSSSTLTWTSTNATSCSATTPSGWTSSTATNGTQSVSPTTTTTYTVTCTGAGGSTPASATVTVTGTTGCTTSSTAWQNTSFSAQTSNFTFDFDATPNANDINSVVGLSNGAATAYSSMAAIARFDPTGDIDAVNGVGSGGNYTAVTTLPYTAGTKYHFTMTVNPTAHTYSMVVTPSGGSATTIATNYPFRSDQATLSTFNNWAVHQDPTSVGSQQVCNAVAATSTKDTTPPTTSITAPTNGATVSGSNVTISATAADNVGVTKVEFYVNNVLLASVPASPYSTPWNTTSLTNGSYSILSKAYDAAGNVGTSAPITVTVNNPDTTPPSVPTNLTATATSATQVNLSWGASTDSGLNASGLDHYIVERGGVAIATVTAPATTYTDNSVVANTSYSYNVVAVDKAGNASAASNTATVTTPKAADTTPPTAPSNLTGSATSYTQVNLTWTASTDPTVSGQTTSGVAGYNIYRGSTKLNSALVTTTTYGDATAAAGTAYSYYVVAVDGAGNVSPQSNTVTVTTPHSLWNAAVTPANTNANDHRADELGTKFQSSVAGTVTGVSFYKGTSDTGTHTGSLWNTSGTRLATVTFANETASGWQKAYFSTPVSITANTTYIISYHTTVGYYSYNYNYFNSAYTSGTLTAPATSNGVYVYGSSAFPNETYQSSNYWVDVIMK